MSLRFCASFTPFSTEERVCFIALVVSLTLSLILCVLFTVSSNPAKISEIEKQFKLAKNLLKYLFVKVDEDKNN